ncbi:Membrane regulatory protein PfoR [Eupransor demetentiae]|uniref:PTS_EIIC_2 domain (Does not regulate perfringolysin expression) (PfoR) n=2 Tax=Eupransor demetentiae TaxID=3109584 RepID=A0ABP0ES49_9LACO|nr:Membrane regulatory protein PfoR [Lactobacillaceae bacterium LMG 33000]
MDVTRNPNPNLQDFEEATRVALHSAPSKQDTREMVYNTLAAVSNAVLVTLGMGLLLQTMATFIHWGPMAQFGAITKVMLPAAFGATIASQMKSNTMVLVSAMAASTVGANAVFFSSAGMAATTATGFTGMQAAGSTIITTGQPISAVLAGVVAVLFGNWISGKTPLDMVLVPASTVLVGTISGYYLAIFTTPILEGMGKGIVATVNFSPVFGTAIVAVAFAILLVTPSSSAALAIAIGATGITSPIAAGAMVIGTTAMYAGFPAMSFHENKIGAVIAQGLVTPKIQFPNIVKNPIIIVPPLVAAAVTAPISTIIFHLTVPYAMAGIGLNSLIVPLALLAQNPMICVVYVIAGVVVSFAISFVMYWAFRKAGWIKPGDMHLELI